MWVFLSRMLCQCGLDVSAKDLDGWTPLHAAAHWGQGDACCILAEQLCNMEARSSAVRPGAKASPLPHAPLLTSLLLLLVCNTMFVGSDPV